MPTDSAVRSAIGRLSERLAKTSVKVGHASALLRNLADSARLYRRLLGSAKSTSIPPDHYQETQRLAAALAPDDNGLGAEHLRSTVMSHRDWLEADTARARIQEQWRLFFANGMPCSTRRSLFRPFRTTIRCRLGRGTFRSTAKGTPFTMRVLYGRTLPAPAASRQPRRQSIVHRPVCQLGCESLDLVSRIARRSPLLNFLNRSLAVSYRLRVPQGDGRLGSARRTSSLMSALRSPAHSMDAVSRMPPIASGLPHLRKDVVGQMLPKFVHCRWRSDSSAGFLRLLNPGILAHCRGRSRRTRIPARGAQAARQSATRQGRAEVAETNFRGGPSLLRKNECKGLGMRLAMRPRPVTREARRS
jgi:hypothetical protein